MKVSVSPTIRKTARVWWPLFVTLTLASLIVYTVVQQSVRQAADDPQVEFSEQLSEQLKDVGDPSSFFATQTPTDIRKSLGVFAIVYGDDFKSLAETGRLDGTTPTVPQGVLEHAKDKGENRVTWQPAGGVRIAAVVRSYSNNGKTNYVLVGRSLREVEKRETKLLEVAAVGWLASSIALFFILGTHHAVGTRRASRRATPATVAKASPGHRSAPARKKTATRAKKR